MSIEALLGEWDGRVLFHSNGDMTRQKGKRGRRSKPPKASAVFKDIYQWLLQIEDDRRLGDRSVGESALG